MTPFFKRYALVALSLAGSAILLFSCDQASEVDTSDEEEHTMTEYCENLTLVESQNGRKSYRFTTPLLEGYSLAKEPYREFRKGVKVITYLDDSMSTVDATLVANYAIYYEKRELWEAKGNVVVEKSDGKTLYTQQLFWNARTKRIYSNVDSKIVQGKGDDVFIGEGFESDEAFKDWRFRRMTGRMRVDVTPSDSTAVDSMGTTPPPQKQETQLSPAPKAEEKSSVRPAVSLPRDRRQPEGPRPVKQVQIENLLEQENNEK